MVGRPDSPASNFDLFLKAVGRERQDRLGSEIAYLLAHLSQAIFEGGEVLAMVAPDEFVLAIGETVEPIATDISRRMNPDFYVIALIQNYYLSSRPSHHRTFRCFVIAPRAGSQIGRAHV